MNITCRSILAIAVLGVFGAGAGAARADDQAVKVLSDLHHANQMEIHMGKMAKEKSQSSDVQAYGDKLVKDHQDADDKVLKIAKDDGITLLAPADQGMMAKMESSKGENKMADLSAKSGADFDRAFLKEMVADHKKDIAKMEKAQKSLTQADVKDLVTNVLPTLREHLAIAQKLSGNA
jgi:putative membrane protein